MKRYLLSFCLAIFIINTYAQESSVSIGTDQTKANAILWLEGNGTQGLLLPIANTANFTPTADEAGMIVFNNSTKKVMYFNGTSWLEVGGTGGASVSISKTGNQIILTGSPGGSITLADTPPSAGTAGQILMWSGSGWTSTSATAPTDGQVMKWNAANSSWVPSTDNSGGTPSVDNVTLEVSAGALKVKDGSIGTNQVSSIAASKITVTPAGNLTSNVLQNALTELQTDIDSKDASATNEIQNLSFTGTGSVNPNEIFDLNLSGGTGVRLQEGTNISIAQTGNTLTINGPAGGGSGTVTQVTAGTGLTGGPITTTGTLAVNVGTGANQIPQLDGTGKLATSVLPATVDNNTTDDITTSTASAGDVTGTFPTLTVDGLQGRTVANTAPTAGQVLKWNQTTSQWEPAADNGTGTVTQVSAGTGLTGGPITTTGTLAVNVGTGANQIPQLDGTGKLASSVLPTTVDNNTTDDITTSTASAGDVTGTFPTLTVDGLQGRTLANTAPTDGQVLRWNNTTSQWEPQTMAAGSGTVTQVTAGTGLTGGPITTTGTIAVDVGTGANQIPILDTNGKLATSTIPNTVDSDATDDITSGTTATGDLSGTYPNPTIVGLQGRTVHTGVPLDQQVLKWSNANNRWEPQNDNSSSVATGNLTSGTTGVTVTGGTGAVVGSGTTIAIQNATSTQPGLLTQSDWSTFNNKVGTTSTPAAGDISGSYSAGFQIGANAVGANEIAGSAVTTAKMGTAGAADANKVYTTNGSGVPTLETKTSFLSGTVTTTTSAGGDLTGTYPNPTISTAATTGATLVTAINNSTSTINTARLGSELVLDSETFTGGNVTGTYSGGLNANNLTDANISNSAGISGSKISPAFSSDVTTTGDVTAAGDVTGANGVFSGDLSVNGVGYTWPGAAGAGVLTSDNAGVLTWSSATGISQVNTATGLTGGGSTSTVTVGLANTAVTPGTYGTAASVPQITVDQQGRITSASNVPFTAGMASPMTTAGDIIVGGLLGTPTRLPIGSNGQVLMVNSGTVAWQNLAGGGTITGVTTAVGSGLTGGGTTGTLNMKLQDGTSFGQVLKWNGSQWALASDDVGGGGVATLSGGQILVGDGTANAAAGVSGDLQMTGSANFQILGNTVAADEIVNGSITDVEISSAAAIGVSKLAGGTANQILQTNGSGVPTWTSLTTGATNLDGLSDAIITTPSAGQLLVYNNTNSNFENRSLTGDISAVSASGAVTIADGAISGGTGGKILDGTIATADLANGSVTNVKIANVNASKINGITSAYVPRSSGSALVDGSIQDNGAEIGVKTAPVAGTTLTVGQSANGAAYFDGNVTISSTTETKGLNVLDVIRLNGNAGTAGQVLTSSGGGTPTWTAMPGTLSAGNGLSLSGSTINLGGTMSSSTTIFSATTDNMLQLQSSSSALGAKAGIRMRMFDSSVADQYDVYSSKSDAIANSGQSDFIISKVFSTAGGMLEAFKIDGNNSNVIINNAKTSSGNFGNFVVANGNIGVGTSTPNAPLQFGNTLSNRKIVFNESANNDHQFFGIGVNSNTMRFQVPSYGTDNFLFYAGVSTTTSGEVFRIESDYMSFGGRSTPLPNSVFDIDSDVGSDYSGMHIQSYDPDGRPFYGYANNGNVRIRTYMDGTTGSWRIQTGSATELLSVTQTGRLGIGTTNPAASLTVGADKFQVDATQGDVTMTDDLGSITFAPADATNAPMINMFSSGTSNADRMVLAHSPSFPNWGLQYNDFNDRFNFLSEGTAVMTVDLGANMVGIGTTTPSSSLEVVGDVEIPSANRYRYSSAKTSYITVSPAAFTAINGLTVDGNSNGNSRWISGGTAGTADILYASLSLPHGAVITGVDVYVTDNDASRDVFFNLISYNMALNVTTTLGVSSTTSGAPGATVLSVTGLNHTVDNTSRSYSLNFRTYQANTTLQIRGVKVTYTKTEVD